MSRDVLSALNLPAGSVPNAALASMGGGTVKGRAFGAVTGAPQDLTSTQLGEIIRFFTGTDNVVAAGTYNDVALTTGPNWRLAPSGSGNVVLTGIALGSSNTGGWLQLLNWGTSGTNGIVLKHENTGSIAANRFKCPDDRDYYLQGGNDAVYLLYVGGRWQVLGKSTDAFGLKPVLNNTAVPFTVRIPFSATGAAGTNIDVTVWNANADFALRLLSAKLRITTAAGGSAALRTASAGGGSVVLPDASNTAVTFSFEAAGRFPDNAGATATVAAAGSLFLRIDRAAAGELILDCVRT
jgi:hypothetical protein